MESTGASTPDYYALLGISEAATEAEVRAAFRERVGAAMYDQPRFAALTEAFEVLKDPGRRAAYDTGRHRASGAWRGGYMNQAISVSPGVPAGATLVTSAPTGAGASLPTVCPFGLTPCPLISGQTIADEGFCPECGLQVGSAVGAPLTSHPLPRLIDAAGRDLPLHVGENIVGRENADVVLPDKTVSRRHARITVAPGNVVTLEDMASTNGTKRNGATVAPGQPLALTDGMAVTFGSVALTIQVPPAPQPERPALAAAGDDAGRPIAALPGPSNARAILLARDGTIHVLKSVETTLGRRASNDIVLTSDAFASGGHASIVFEGDAYHLVDLGSTNGTRLNGRKLAARAIERLKDGDTILVGQSQFIFQAPQ